MNDNMYDIAIYIDNSVNEDNRNYTKTVDYRQSFQNDGIDNKSLYTNNNYGRMIQREITSLGDGFSGEVTDYGKWVVVSVSYHNHVTGKTVGKTFLIVFDTRGDSVVFSTANRWRTASGYSQAISYIKSVCGNMKNQTNSI